MSHIESSWSYAACFVEMKFNETSLACGSGFFWKFGGRIFLVSNWHNFSGIDPTNGRVMSPTAGLPNRVSIQIFRRLSDADRDGFFEMKVDRIECNISDPSDYTKCYWLEHPTYGRQVDVAALPLDRITGDIQLGFANETEDDAVIPSSVSQDVFIVGYPLGLITGAPSPVWKRGTIATEPTFDAGGLPMLYVDSATRKGMSGSVVIARHIIVGSAYTRKDGQKSEVLLYGRKDTVLGVYSGRVGEDENQAQLGRVWKRRTIEEVIGGGRLARPH
jgi:hypothetical protein